MPDLSPPLARGRRAPLFTKSNASELGRRGAAARTAALARKQALAAAALAAGNANLEILFRGSLNATLEALLARYRIEVNRNPLRPKHCREILDLAGANARLLGINLEKAKASSKSAPEPGRPVLEPTLATTSPAAAPSTTQPPKVDEPPELESAPLD